MREKIYFTAIFITVFFLSSCEKLLEPQRDNRLTMDQVISNPVYAEGILLNAYDALPESYNFSESATDDAVTNAKSGDYNEFLRMATGEWKSTFDPQETWNWAYTQIYYINLFLETYEKVEWSWESPEKNANYLKRFKGEAHGLRAWYEFQLLQAHSGMSADNQLLGFPIVLNSLSAEDDLELPRDTYEDCVAQILSDCDIAIDNLPAKYEDVDDPFYDVVFGKIVKNRMNGDGARGLRSRVTLHAASPAFTVGLSAGEVQAKWETAARTAGELLFDIGGPAELSLAGHKFYLATKDPTLAFDPDIIWRNDYTVGTDVEEDIYPPTLFGQGYINPSQNLVDAFPMQNGYPIMDASSGYDPANPYINRDPRLREYIIYNGNALRKFFSIYTQVGATKDGINATTESTRTGYYLKKFTRPEVNLDPNSGTGAEQFYTYFRYSEVFLNFAEAANEAWGPDGDPMGYGFTARNVIAAIRSRAGISQPDAHLAVLNTVNEMRDLIQNERRLELCFEGFRFWDLRRWNKSLNETTKGVFITGTTGNLSYDYQDIENRQYQPYMIYGPIPYDETLIYDLKQNSGW